MAKSAPNPLADTAYPSSSPSPPSPPISQRTLPIAGLLCAIYGLSELPPSTSSLACLWLLHPRLQSQECMAPIAASILHDYNKSRTKGPGGKGQKGLIAISFDQRNHGSRLVDALANESWRGGNERHAVDMWGIYSGTAHDTMHLLSLLPAYLPSLLPNPSTSTPSITHNLVLGISLGAHSAWHLIMQSSLITSAVIIIGTPNYTALMSDRARRSRRPTATPTTTTAGNGTGFVGSSDFPPGLVEQVKVWDPAGCVASALGREGWPDNEGEEGRKGKELSEADKERIAPLMHFWFGGKKILCLSGGADKLVPYRCGEGFLAWVKRRFGEGRRGGTAGGGGGAAAGAGGEGGAEGGREEEKEGWWEKGDGRIEDLVFEGVGHEVSGEMVREAVRFVGECVRGGDHDDGDGKGEGEGGGDGDGGAQKAAGGKSRM